MKSLVLCLVIVLSFSRYSNALDSEKEIEEKTAQLSPEEFFIHQVGTADGIVVSLAELQNSNTFWGQVKNTDKIKGQINIPLNFAAEIIKKVFSGLIMYKGAAQDLESGCNTVPKFRLLKQGCIRDLRNLKNVVSILDFLDFVGFGKIRKIYDDALNSAVTLGISI